jgi:hypothetical protein
LIQRAANLIAETKDKSLLRSASMDFADDSITRLPFVQLDFRIYFDLHLRTFAIHFVMLASGRLH